MRLRLTSGTDYMAKLSQSHICHSIAETVVFWGASAYNGRLIIQMRYSSIIEIWELLLICRCQNNVCRICSLVLKNIYRTGVIKHSTFTVCIPRKLCGIVRIAANRGPCLFMLYKEDLVVIFVLDLVIERRLWSLIDEDCTQIYETSTAHFICRTYSWAFNHII